MKQQIIHIIMSYKQTILTQTTVTKWNEMGKNYYHSDTCTYSQESFAQGDEVVRKDRAKTNIRVYHIECAQ